jgi:hypothetical protein
VKNLRKKNGFAILASVAAPVAVVVMVLATFSPEVARSGGRGFAQSGAVDASAVNAFAGAGVASSGEAPFEVNLGDLPEATAQQLAAPRLGYRPLDGLSDAEHQARKQQARERAAAGPLAKTTFTGANSLPSEGAEPSGPLGPALTGIGLSPRFAAHQQTPGLDGTPPDLAVAVSGNFVVEFVNNSISVYDKLGNLKPGYPKSADTFFTPINSPPFTGYTTDPRGFYDWTYHHFVFIMLTESNPNNPKGPANVGSLLMAVSKTNDPTGVWFVYNPAFQIGKTGECPDFPTLGNDSVNWGTGATMGGIYVGINQFGTSGICQPSPPFIGNYFFMIPKDPLYKGAPFSDWINSNGMHGGTLVDTFQPANMVEPADRPSAVLFVNTLNLNFGGGNGLVLWSVSNPFGFLSGGGSPVFTGVDVTTTNNYSLPPSADEPNGTGGVCTGCIATGDNRISGAVTYHAGDLFGSFNTANSGSPTASFIWFDVHPNLSAFGDVTLAYERQEDCVFCGLPNGHNASWFYATVQPDGENNLVMALDSSSDIFYPSMGFASRRVNHNDNQLAAFGGTALFPGLHTIPCAPASIPCRWGDYTATAVDLVVPSRPAMWVAGHYANRAGSWGTGIVRGRYLRPTDQ